MPKAEMESSESSLVRVSSFCWELMELDDSSSSSSDPWWPEGPSSNWSNSLGSAANILHDPNIVLTPRECDVFGIVREAATLGGTGTVARVAGGWVRDKLLGKSSDDIDIALDNMKGTDFAALVQQVVRGRVGEAGVKQFNVIKANPSQSKHLETATMRVVGTDVDFVHLRTETYSEGSRIPEVQIGTAAEDSFRRDLTINALFFNINDGSIEDFTGHGLDDLQRSLIRTPLNPLTTFLDDPLRVLRAVRFAGRFGFRLHPLVAQAARAEAVQRALREKVSRERVGTELAKMLRGNRATESLMTIFELGLPGTVFALPGPGQDTMWPVLDGSVAVQAQLMALNKERAKKKGGGGPDLREGFGASQLGSSLENETREQRDERWRLEALAKVEREKAMEEAREKRLRDLEAKALAESGLEPGEEKRLWNQSLRGLQLLLKHRDSGLLDSAIADGNDLAASTGTGNGTRGSGGGAAAAGDAGAAVDIVALREMQAQAKKAAFLKRQAEVEAKGLTRAWASGGGKGKHGGPSTLNQDSANLNLNTMQLVQLAVVLAPLRGITCLPPPKKRGGQRKETSLIEFVLNVSLKWPKKTCTELAAVVEHCKKWKPFLSGEGKGEVDSEGEESMESGQSFDRVAVGMVVRELRETWVVALFAAAVEICLDLSASVGRSRCDGEAAAALEEENEEAATATAIATATANAKGAVGMKIGFECPQLDSAAVQPREGTTNLRETCPAASRLSCGTSVLAQGEGGGDEDARIARLDREVQKTLRRAGALRCRVVAEGLAQTWKLRPLVDGRALSSIGLKRGPMFAVAIRRAIAWQLGCPTGSKEQCTEFLKGLLEKKQLV